MMPQSDTGFFLIWQTCSIFLHVQLFGGCCQARPSCCPVAPLSPSISNYLRIPQRGRGEDPFFLKRRRFTVPPLFRTFPPLFSTFLPLFGSVRNAEGFRDGGEGSYFTLELPWGQRGEDRTHTHTQENEKEGGRGKWRRFSWAKS